MINLITILSGRGEMKQACRIFNLLIPFTSYRELRSMSERTEKPVAEIVR